MARPSLAGVIVLGMVLQAAAAATPVRCADHLLESRYLSASGDSEKAIARAIDAIASAYYKERDCVATAATELAELYLQGGDRYRALSYLQTAALVEPDAARDERIAQLTAGLPRLKEQLSIRPSAPKPSGFEAEAPPEFQFHYSDAALALAVTIVPVYANGQYSRYQHVSHVLVLYHRPDSLESELLTLPGDSQEPGMKDLTVHTSSLNFDEHPDLRLLSHSAPRRNQYFTVLIYDSTSNRFAVDKALSSITNLRLHDSKHGVYVSAGCLSVAECYYQEYERIGGRVVTTRRYESTGWPPNRGAHYMIVDRDAAASGDLSYHSFSVTYAPDSGHDAIDRVQWRKIVARDPVQPHYYGTPGEPADLALRDPEAFFEGFKTWTPDFERERLLEAIGH